ncbi:BMP family protein [Kitasatospora aureofaciens]|uniref:BMP family ABC transporter substrate-binding protein n=1 Tax=Kitasatospora aureofaciens TaxID=1894 RepID=A0A1E7N5X5_KITAU|nr:BMP family ABC transporter substrate-binding protein [Kitasatospora aureofaciens]QEV01274.1 BMP family ABC transporter substrate-binding protein [Streptomyces viridifaciens]ARF80029.1 BMP family ABC transporter substrate-binding protein [Kitasatospora aureofaciens]OEV36085.1 BMP family ABC transporter substrate-binding protein [Kitasatospora aureofaciens]UKZ07645.1 BMP family ABC transporter substrate-binding protein [Streptomyces viridifaciens]GGU91722.1 BMP family ABC transporter substrat
MRRSMKLAAVVLSGSLGMASLAACGAKSTDTNASSGSSSDALKVGMAYDIGGRGDQSFNDSAARGLDKAKADLGVNVTEAEAKTGEAEADKETRLKNLIDGGYKTIVAVGFVYQQAVDKVAKDNPNVKFAIIDSNDKDQPSNVTSLLFAEQEGSYLAGVAAANKSKAHHIGFIGGVQSELIKKFEAGYKAGAKSVDPNIQIETTYLTTPPDFSGFNSPDKGKEAAQGQLDKGADVIYSAAGSSGNGAIEAVATAGKWAIGVDSDQASQPALAKFKNNILTSMVKNVDNAVYAYIDSVKKNTPFTGIKLFDLKANGVSLATTGGKIDDIQDKLKAASDAITSGATTIPTAPTS